MHKRLGSHVRQNVIGYIALFFALTGGVAWATHPGGANTISSGDIQNNQVFSADVRDDTLTAGGLVSADVRNDTQTSPAGGLGAADLKPGAVGTSEVANNSLTGNDILESSLGKVGDANMLDGLDSTSFVPNAKLRRIGPISATLPPGGSGQTIEPIATLGHFTFTGSCAADQSTGLGAVQLSIESDVDHSAYGSLTQSQPGGQFGQADMSAGSSYTVAVYGPATTGFPRFDPATGSAVAPDGQQVTFDVYQGAGAAIQDCVFGGTFAVN